MVLTEKDTLSTLEADRIRNPVLVGICFDVAPVFGRVEAPFPYVSMHVEKAPVVGFE